jgi:hypothetical protein
MDNSERRVLIQLVALDGAAIANRSVNEVRLRLKDV